MKRRSFITNNSLAALGSSSIANTLLNLKLMTNAAADTVEDDYRAIVCVFLNGGCDSYNLLVPTSADEYANYSRVRSGLALPLPGAGGRDELLPLNLSGTGGRNFGLHGAMPQLRTRMNDGNATMLANVGTLAEPPNVAAIRAGSALLPRSLFSHNSQQATWQTGLTRDGSATGWGGRLADRLLSRNISNDVSMGVSLAGNQTLLVGNDTIPFAIGPDGSTSLTGTGSADLFDARRVAAARSIAAGSSEHLLMRAFAEETESSVALSEQFSTAFNQVDLQSSFGGAGISQDLRAVARSIGSSRDLGLRRQIFFVNYGDFDQHAVLAGPLRGWLSGLDSALASFWEALGELDAQENVVTFTCSEFGRTLRSNGGGTDHGWGGNAIVMGGPVRQRLLSDGINSGSRIYGSYPDESEMSLGRGLDVGSNGRLIPTTSTDEYFAELALWLGLSRGELEDVLPNIGSFYSPGATDTPLGMLPAV